MLDRMVYAMLQLFCMWPERLTWRLETSRTSGAV